MKALQLKKIGQLDLIDTDIPAVAADQLLVRTGAAVVCTSDLNDVRENPFSIPLPVVMGHEGAGTVAKVGRAVRGFAAGDRVAAHPVHPCGKCVNCANGVGHLCSAMGHFGLNLPGVFAEYFIVRADRARKLPPAVSFAQAALAEPVCVCLEALAQARVKTGGSVLILGDGAFGILIAMLGRPMGLGKVVIVGHHDFRLAQAAAAGAVAVNAKRVDNVKAALAAQAGGAGFDAAILAVGRSEAFAQGLDLLRPQGRMVVFSAMPGQTPVDLFNVHVKELEIVGACNDQDRLDQAVEVLAAQGGELDKLVTHRFRLEQFRQAFDLAANSHQDAIKVAFEFD